MQNKVFRTTGLHCFYGLILLASFLLAGCDSTLFNDPVPCTFRLKFKYDFNMKYADAFANEVDYVDVFVYEAEGSFVTSKRIERSQMTSGNTAVLDLIPGKYTFVVWSGLKDQLYKTTPLTAGKSKIGDFRLNVNTKDGATLKQDLTPLFHGILENVVVTGEEHQEATVSLMKDTNKIRFVIYSDNPDQLLPSVVNYDIRLVAQNGTLTGANAIGTDESTVYLPYAVGDFGSDLKGAKYPGAWFEVSTLRLLAQRTTTLVITDKVTGKVLLNCDINQFLSEMRFVSQMKMPLQEYFDREDSYRIVFIIGKDADFLSFLVEVNGWLIRKQSINIVG